MSQTTTLSQIPCGGRCSVLSTLLDEASARRFEILGMTDNAVVEVITKKKKGALIVRLRGTRFAVGLAHAEKIIVAPITEDKAGEQQ